MTPAMPLNGGSQQTVISSNRRSVSEVTCWFDDLADDYIVARPGTASCQLGRVLDRPMAVSNADERNPDANRFGTCCSAERGLCLRLLDVRGGTQPRVHLRSHRGRPLRAQRRDQIPQ